MSNHIHMIISSDKTPINDIMRDFKKFTSKQIFNAIENNPHESRRSWLRWLLQKEDGICFWQEGYHPEEIVSRDFYETKLNYIHLNPVRAGLVEKEEEYLYSSCAHFYGTRKGFLELAYV